MRTTPYNLAHESDENDLAVVEPITVTDAIDDTEAHAELHANIANIDSMIEANADATERLDTLDTVVSDSEVKLQTPEVVTVDDVLLAQESMRTTMVMLGYQPSQGMLASEAAGDPVRALQLSTEGAKEFILKAITAIKNILKKIIESLKKMYVNILAWLNSSDKQAKALVEKLGKSTKSPDSDIFQEKDFSRISKYIGVVVAAGEGDSKDKHKLKELLHSYLQAVTDIDTVTSYANTVVVGVKSVVAMVNDRDKLSYDNGVLVRSNMYNVLANKHTSNAFLKGLLKHTSDTQTIYNSSNGHVSDIKLLRVIERIPAEYHGNTFKTVDVLEFNTKTGDREDKYYLKVDIWSGSRALRDEYTVAVLDKADIILLLNEIVSNKNKRKKYIDDAYASISNMDDVIENIEKAAAMMKSTNQNTPELTSVVKEYIKSVNIGVTAIAYGGIMSNIKGTQGVFKFCNMCAKEYL